MIKACPYAEDRQQTATVGYSVKVHALTKCSTIRLSQ